MLSGKLKKLLSSQSLGIYAVLEVFYHLKISSVPRWRRLVGAIRMLGVPTLRNATRLEPYIQAGAEFVKERALTVGNRFTFLDLNVVFADAGLLRAPL